MIGVGTSGVKAGEAGAVAAWYNRGRGTKGDEHATRDEVNDCGGVDGSDRATAWDAGSTRRRRRRRTRISGRRGRMPAFGRGGKAMSAAAILKELKAQGSESYRKVM